MSFDFIRIQGVVNDEIPLSEYLNNELRFKWAISSSGFSGPSWNILRRALMKFDFGGVEYPGDYIEIEILDQLTLRDLKQIKHAGTKRIELLLNELTNSSKEFSLKTRPDLKKLSDLEEDFPVNNDSGVLERIILTEILTSEDWREDFQKKFFMHFDYSIFDDESVSRRLAIFESRINGETLAEIGDRFGITRERVRQIVEKSFAKIKDNPIFEGKSISAILEERQNSELAAQANKSAAEIKATDLEIRKSLNDNPGMKYSELSEILAISEDQVKSRISYQASKFIFQEPTAHNFQQQFSDEFTLDAIRMAAAIRSPLSSPMYESLVERGLVKGPRSQMIAKRFGSWSHACRIAGVLYVHSVRGEYSRTWTEEESLVYIVGFLKNTEFGLGVLGYDDWRESCEKEAPSSAHLRNTFGTWILSKNKALEYMRKNKISCDLI
jgi:hypothetical protein